MKNKREIENKKRKKTKQVADYLLFFPFFLAFFFAFAI
jgi:hypothetical protein